jgi:uncharacterized protein YndB with AHSA1/START domain
MARHLRWIIAMAVLSLAGQLRAEALAPDIAVSTIVNAPIADVWKSWTTVDGIESFFAPKAVKVEPVLGGAFELWFDVNGPEGQRGSEGCRIHSLKRGEQLVFEWNAPPHLPNVRKLRTLVYLDLKSIDATHTEVTLQNYGYGQGDEWAKARDYFAHAWPSVLDRLEKHYARR